MYAKKTYWMLLLIMPIYMYTLRDFERQSNTTQYVRIAVSCLASHNVFWTCALLTELAQLADLIPPLTK